MISCVSFVFISLQYNNVIASRAGGGGSGARRLDLRSGEFGRVAAERKALGHVAALDVDTVALSEALRESRDERRGDELEHGLKDRALEDVAEERRSFGLE